MATKFQGNQIEIHNSIKRAVVIGLYLVLVQGTTVQLLKVEIIKFALYRQNRE